MEAVQDIIDREIKDLTSKFFPKFKPFNEFILVQEVGEGGGEKISKGGIVLPDVPKAPGESSSNEDLMEVVVVAISDGVLNENTGEFRKPRVAEHDHLWISTHHRSRNPQPWGKEEVRVIQEADIVAHLTKNEYEDQMKSEDESA
jgi:co-chaperonin GroES (HSP10)